MKHLRTLFYVSIFATVSYLFTGCASMSCMQTARTTEKGRLVGGFGGGSASVNTGLKDSTGKNIAFSLPFIELFARYGITDRLDVGAKLTLIGTGLLDVKYMLVGNQESVFAASIGTGIGEFSTKSGNYSNTATDWHIPLYVSVHPTNWLGIYVNPRYVMRFNAEDNNGVKNSYNSSWYGLTTGLRFGKKTGFFIEYSYFGNSTTSVPFTQITAGLGFGVR